MKRILLISVAVILTLAVVFLFFRLKLEISGQDIHADALLPSNADLVILENDPARKAFADPNLEGLFCGAGFKASVALVDSLYAREYLDSRLSYRIAVNKKKEPSYVAVYPLSSEKENLKAFLSSLFKRIYGKAPSLYKLENGILFSSQSDGIPSAAIIGKWMLLTDNTAFLLHESYGEKAACDSLSKYERYMSRDAELNIYAGKGKYIQGAGWTVLDIYVSDSEYAMKGLVSVTDSVWYRMLEGQHSETSGFDRYFVSSFNSIHWLNLEDVNRWTSNPYIENSLSKTTGNFDEFIKRIHACLKGNIALINAYGGKVMLFELKSQNGVMDLLRPLISSENSFRAGGFLCWKGLGRNLGKFFDAGVCNEDMEVLSMMGDVLVFASSDDVMRRYMTDYKNASLLVKENWYSHYLKKQPSRFTYAVLGQSNAHSRKLPKEISAIFGGQFMKEGGVWGFQVEEASDNLYLSSVAFSQKRLAVQPEVSQKESGGSKTVPESKEIVGAKTRLSSVIKGSLAFDPVKVRNHITHSDEWFVQDNHSNIYLINDRNEILWEAPVDGKIVSSVYQVDRYRNGKLQYLFSTLKSVYLVDRNGVLVNGFPIRLLSSCKKGISLFDYDKNRNYRIFVPSVNNRIYLYGIDGRKVSGWNSPKCQNDIVSRVAFFRVGGKDYILAADRAGLYIWDRRGNIRIPCKVKFDFGTGDDVVIGQESYKGKNVFTVKSANKNYYIDLEGKEVN